MAIICLLLSVAFFLQQAQLFKLRRTLKAITDAAASFLEVHPHER